MHYIFDTVGQYPQRRIAFAQLSKRHSDYRQYGHFLTVFQPFLSQSIKNYVRYSIVQQSLVSKVAFFRNSPFSPSLKRRENAILAPSQGEIERELIYNTPGIIDKFSTKSEFTTNYSRLQPGMRIEYLAE